LSGYIKLRVVPLELKEANALVAMLHRHHKPCQGHRFSIGVIDETNSVRGAVIVGRPVARMVNSKQVLEVTRLVTDGTKNACSMLYSAAARVGRSLGYKKIQTYILAGEESGISLLASGWTCDGQFGGGQWKHTDGKARRSDQPTGLKLRWSKQLNAEVPEQVFLPTPMITYDDDLAELLG
jgi:hypothetical protein